MREVGLLKKDPETLREQIEKLEMMSKYFIFLEHFAFVSFEIGCYTFQTKSCFHFS